MTAQQEPTPGVGIRTSPRGRQPIEFPGAAAVPARERTRWRMSDFVYEELTEAIRSLRLAPGAPLSEPAVATWLQVSRGPVREAFTRLVDQGLVTVVPQVGSKVAPISMQAVREGVFIRNALEKSAFQQAIGLDNVDTRELHDLVDRNRDAANRNDAEEYFQTDEQLHQLVFALAGVPRLWEVVRGTKVNLDRLRRLHLGTAITDPEIVAEHQAIADAIDTRDEATGLRVIHRHSNRILGDTEKLRDEFPEFFVA